MRSGIRKTKPETKMAAETAGCCGRTAGSSSPMAARQAASACTEAFVQNYFSYASVAARGSTCKFARGEPAGCENFAGVCTGGKTSCALPAKISKSLRLRRGAVLHLPVLMRAGSGFSRCRAGLKPGLRGAACRSRAETRSSGFFKFKRRQKACLTVCRELRKTGAGHGF